MDKRKEISKMLFLLGVYYDREITKEQLAMYVEDLMGLDLEELANAITLYRQDPDHHRFPLPAQLIGLVKPKQSTSDAAREASANIIKCIARYGPYQGQIARETMGELAWSVVQSNGGWSKVCETLNYNNETGLSAQWRELAASLHRSGKRDALGNVSYLEDRKKEGLSQLGGQNMLAQYKKPE